MLHAAPGAGLGTVTWCWRGSRVSLRGWRYLCSWGKRGPEMWDARQEAAMLLADWFSSGYWYFPQDTGTFLRILVL